MAGDETRRLDHVVLPRRVPGLALLERYFPSPAANLLDAELTAFARPGDTILDPWAGTGWTARRAIAQGMRAVSADASPFAQLAARAFLQAPDAASIDAALGQLAASRRVDVPLAQHLEELYATRCPACRTPVVADQFIWPRGADAPARKVYRCETCDVAVGGPTERSAPVDEHDLAKLGIDRPVGDEVDEPSAADGDEEELPPAPVGLIGAQDEEALGEAGGPPPPPRIAPDPPVRAPANDPRWASTVHPPLEAPSVEPADAHHIQAVRDRFPVLDGRDALVDELIGLYTPRNLYALEAIAGKIDAELRNDALAALFRLALAACLLPASRLNGYPGRVASLRIAGGHVRQPASRHQREVNVWRLFTDAVADVRTAVAALGHDRRPARFASDLEELGGVSAANVLWIRCRPAVVGQYLPPDSVDMVLGSAGAPPSIDELSFEYLATAWLMGREAAGTLRLEPLFGSTAPRGDGVEPASLRRALTSAAGALRPDGWCNVLLEGDDPERLLAVAIAGAAAGLDLVDVIHRESRRSGDGVVVHFRKPSAEDRLRAAVSPRPLRLGTERDHLTYPELAEAMERAVVALLRDRGEPAGLTRLTAAVVVELARDGLLRRVARMRAGDQEGEASPPDRVDGSGHAVLAELLREELWRIDHPALVRLGDDAHPAWWLREPSIADAPLADRVEWATFSVLTTAGRLDEAAFLDRIYALFPGLQAPDEELVRACLAAYAHRGERGELRTEEELASRLEEHARTLATVADLGHRLGMRVWLSKREQARPWRGSTLGALLRDDERRAYLPLIVRAPAEALGEMDAIWYVRGKFAFLIEVEWTAMLGEPILRRGRQIEPADDQVRLLIVPAERTELLRGKLERSPWLRSEMERQNWHILKWQHLDTLAARDAVRLEWLEPVLGLDPLIERGGEQLTMFGE